MAPSSMSMSIVHVHAHAACSCPCCMPMSCMPMSMLYFHVDAACPCPCYMFMPTLHALARVACPCSRCMPLPMLHFNAACPQTVAFWTTKLAAFCKGEINRALHNTCLADDQDHRGGGHPPKGHRGQGLQEIQVLDWGCDGGWWCFSSLSLILHVPVHLICEFGINILKINCSITFLLKNCRRGLNTAPTL